MTIPVVCPACKRHLHVPEKLAGRRVTCTRCGAPVRAPLPEEPPKEAPMRAPTTRTAAAAAADATPSSARLGIGALVLGLVAILILCVPLVGYASLGLSGIGLMLGIAGLFYARTESMRRMVSCNIACRAYLRGEQPAVTR